MGRNGHSPIKQAVLWAGKGYIVRGVGRNVFALISSLTLYIGNLGTMTLSAEIHKISLNQTYIPNKYLVLNVQPSLYVDNTLLKVVIM